MKFFYEGTLAKVKEALATEQSEGRGVFQFAWEEGSRWTLEEAVNIVLG